MCRHMPKPSAPPPRRLGPWFAALLSGVLLTACAPFSALTSPPSPTASSCANGARDFGLATAVPGPPDPSDHLFDARQFQDRLLYPEGYHWKVDARFKGTDVVTVQRVTGQPGINSPANLVLITFNAEGALRVQQDSVAAYSAPADSPTHSLAFLAGTEILSTPVVGAPADSVVELGLPATLPNGKTPARILQEIC